MFTLNACQKCASHSPKVLKLPPLTSDGPGNARRYPAEQEHKLRAYLEGKARFLIERA